jgi:hypothetical protein
MSAYVSCPSCGGRGLIPLKEAQPIEAHAAQEQLARQQREWSYRGEMVRLDNELRQRPPEQRQADTERRLRELERRAGAIPQAGSAA